MAGATDESTLHVSRSATRALDLMDVVVSAGSISLTDAAERTGIPISTTLRHLRALMSKGWLTRDIGGNYAVGPTFLRLGINAFREGPWARLTAAALPFLEKLVNETDESAYLAVRDGTEAVYVSTVESPRAISHTGWVGRSVPIEGTATGRALTAEVPPTGSGEPVPVFRNVGAVEDDVSAVCVPIVDQGQVIGALTILGPADRLTGPAADAAAEAVRSAATALSATLAGR